MSIWTHELLDRLRMIGDPELDTFDGADGWRGVRVAGAAEAEAAGRADPRAIAPTLLQVWRRSPAGALPLDDIERLQEETPEQLFFIEDPFWTQSGESLSPKRIATARSLFVVYGGEIAASLLLAGLPSSYAAEAGAGVLAETAELRSHARRRIAETSQLVVEVLLADKELMFTDPHDLWVVEPAVDQALPLGSRGYVRVRTTRLTHAVIRSILLESGRWEPTASCKIPARKGAVVGLPVNQEDLLGTLLTFTVVVFETMAKLGVPWNDEAEQAYCDLWDRVAEGLGIGTRAVTDVLTAQGMDLPDEYVGRLRPKTPAEARELCELIRNRTWPMPLPGRVLGPFANSNGKLLVRALLDELQSAMPRGGERLPLFLMRYLMDPRAHELLGLGGGGLTDSLMRWPDPQRFTRRAPWQAGKLAVGAGMRLAANEVSRRAFVHFIRAWSDNPDQSPFWFPPVPDKRTVIPSGRSDG